MSKQKKKSIKLSIAMKGVVSKNLGWNDICKGIDKQLQMAKMMTKQSHTIFDFEVARTIHGSIFSDCFSNSYSM